MLEEIEDALVFQQAAASSYNALALADLQGNLVYVNPAFCRLWGLEGEQEALGHSAAAFWQEPQAAAAALAAGVAMVHQHFSLVPNMTVLENLMLGQVSGVPRRKACAERIEALSSAYGLKLDASRRVDGLSVGERQRVEVVKCLMREPRLLLLDEPTAVLPPD